MAKYGAALLSSSPPWQRASDLALLRQEPLFPPLEVPSLPWLQSGIARGAISEITGQRSSGRTAAVLHVLSAATARGEVCAFIDTYNQFHPASAERLGVRLPALAWVQCDGRVERAIRSTDLLLHAGGFGVVVLDLCETRAKALNAIPLSYWFRFRRAIESTPTILLIVAEASQAKSCSVNIVKLRAEAPQWEGGSGARLLRGMHSVALSQKPPGARPHPFRISD